MKLLPAMASCILSCLVPAFPTCQDTLRLIDAIEKENEYLLATDKGLLRLDKGSALIDKGFVRVGSNQIDQIRDNGRGYLLSVWDGCGFDVTTPCGIYQVSYDLKEVKRAGGTPIPYRNAALLYSRFDSVFIGLANGGAFVSRDFMKTWSYVGEGPGSKCEMDLMTWDYLEYGQTLYLANRSGLFAYRPFADTTANLFCNAPNHYSGEILRYGDSMVVSDSGYVYRISKLGENAWRPFPLPGDVSVITCARDIFSGYFVYKNQKNGCAVPDSIRIGIVDLKTRRPVAMLNSSDYGYPIDYMTAGDKLIVSLGREGIAVYDGNLRRTVFKHQDCGTTGLANAAPESRAAGLRLRTRSIDGRKRSLTPERGAPGPVTGW